MSDWRLEDYMLFKIREHEPAASQKSTQQDKSYEGQPERNDLGDHDDVDDTRQALVRVPIVRSHFVSVASARVRCTLEDSGDE